MDTIALLCAVGASSLSTRYDPLTCRVASPKVKIRSSLKFTLFFLALQRVAVAGLGREHGRLAGAEAKFGHRAAPDRDERYDCPRQGQVQLSSLICSTGLNVVHFLDINK